MAMIWTIIVNTGVSVILVNNKYSFHANGIYYCDSCDYKTTILDNSKTHIKSIHKGVRSMIFVI